MAIRKRGKAFIADYYDGNGRRRWKTFALEREARAFEAKVRQEVARGEHVPEAEMPRFAEVATRFLDAKRGQVRDLTLAHYETATETFLVPYFGHLRLNTISVALIERYRSELCGGLPAPLLRRRADRLATLAAKRAEKLGNPALARPSEHFRTKLAQRKLSPITINKQLTLLVMIFNYALKHRLLTFNPAEHVDKLPTVHRESDAIDHWREVGALAVRIGTLTEYDVPLLALLSRTLATVDELEESIRRDGAIIASGETRKSHPALAAADRARLLAHRLLGEFGLAPLSREKLSLDPPKDDSSNEFDVF